MNLPNNLRIKHFLSLIIVINSSFYGFSQTNNSYAFPSANNSFLGAAGNSSSTSVGVDLYTGTAEITIPLTNLASKEIGIPISLNYSGSRGIRVQDYASFVGLGWQLNAGGNISRVVRGFPDEQRNGYLGNGSLPSGAIGTGGQWGKVVANNLGPNHIALTSSQSVALTGINGSTMGVPTADGEPDIYYVRTPFFGFQFTFDENGNPVTSNYTGIKIISSNFINTSNYANSSFEVIDDQGNQFYFGSSSASVETSTTSLFGTSYTFPSTWYLDKIITYNSKDVITFTYTSFFNSDVLEHYQSSTTYDYSHTDPADNTPIQTTINQPKVLSTISTSLGEADFTYASDRRDDPNSVRLSSLKLLAYDPAYNYNRNTLQTFGFYYSYFGDPSSDPNILRLRLDNITIAGNTTATSTPVTLKSFLYNTSVYLPSRQSLSAIDFWGYYTYTTSPNTYNQALPPNQTYAMADILTTITDIAGGSYVLNYELNTYYNSTSSTNIQVGGLRVSQISRTLPTGESLSTQYKYIDINNNSTGQILSNSYSINFWTTSCNANGSIYKTLSESPSDYYDLNGNFVGYSLVKEVNQNGGYTISTFSNFLTPNCADTLQYATTDPIPDISSSISAAYKRGLMLDRSVYNVAGQILSEDASPLTSYSAQTSPVQNKAWAYHWNNLTFTVSASGYLNSCTFGASSTYHTNVENFRLLQSVHTDYDQQNTSNKIQTTTNYTYSSVNRRLIKSISISDSKGQTFTKTFNYPDETGIPMVTSTEQTAITAMVNANRINLPVHEVDVRNGVTTQIHNSYMNGIGSNNNGFANTYLASTTSYNGSIQATQELFNYDGITSNMISSNALAGKSSGVSYGYNSTYPIAKATNATSTISYSNQPLAQTGYLNIPPNTWGGQVTTFTNSYPGTITIAMPSGSYLNGSITCYFSFSLSGPSNGSGNLCNNSATGYTCSAPNSVSFSNMPSGTYTLTVTAYTNTATSNVPITFAYTGQQLIATPYSEFFFEGFEESPYTIGSAHTGNMYCNSNYTVTYVPPNSRSYTIQYWNLSGGVWNFNEMPYSANMVLTGPVDDIRVFPSDALMTSYTYNPLVGKTSETDAAGRSVIYQYDGFNRLQTVRDQDNNILKQYDYQYQLLATPAANEVEYGTFQKTCSAGYIGSMVTYTVPAGVYHSYISQDDANQQAINDVNANGQAYANNPANGGTCAVAESITYTDSRAFQYSVRFTNNSTGLIYNFTPNANSSGTLGQVPSGTYTVYICPINNYTPNNNYTVGSSTQTNVVCATFNNVSVTSNISLRFY